ncbi:MAG: PEP-CTERM sorting domain-containing protein [Opitutaceae bacterium]|jgi:hypothetical protein|nr:PEP-CTERM sorting domain-containing protein [Opitutaceae bacterium]
MKTNPQPTRARIARVLPGLAAATFLLAGNPASAITYTGITSASEIDPAGGDSISYGNPNWNTWFVKKGTGTDTYTAVSKATFNSLADRFILDFEATSGFGNATQKITSNGSIFTATNSLEPFDSTSKISKITTSTGAEINVWGCSYNSTTDTIGAANDAYGAFLVGDRDANDTMVSGTQGITVGRYNTASGYANGVYLQFDRDLEYFTATLNTASSSPIYRIALLDANGSLLALYGGGVGAGVAMSFGVKAEEANIRSVWIGFTTSTNGFVIDDIGFVFAATAAVPEPSTFAVIFGISGLAATLFLRRKYQN